MTCTCCPRAGFRSPGRSCARRSTGTGCVYDRAADYRRAVDEALFGLGEHRYEALINLLIQLRQPQLSKKPDEKLLSRALTEALPPLSPGLVTTVAEAFRGLDEERDALRALAEARERRDRIPAPLPQVRAGRRQAQGDRAASGAEQVRTARPGPDRGGGGVRGGGRGAASGAAASWKNSSRSGPGWRRGARRCGGTPRCAMPGSWTAVARTRDSGARRPGSGSRTRDRLAGGTDPSLG